MANVIIHNVARALIHRRSYNWRTRRAGITGLGVASPFIWDAFDDKWYMDEDSEVGFTTPEMEDTHIFEE